MSSHLLELRKGSFRNICPKILLMCQSRVPAVDDKGDVTSSISSFKVLGLPIFLVLGGTVVPYRRRNFDIRWICRFETSCFSAISSTASRRKRAAVICSRCVCVRPVGMLTLGEMFCIGRPAFCKALLETRDRGGWASAVWGLPLPSHVISCRG